MGKSACFVLERLGCFGEEVVLRWWGVLKSLSFPLGGVVRFKQLNSSSGDCELGAIC
jgi:hypothetical protein